MEFHWYEDYWKMPNRLPVGQDFSIGFYQTGRAVRHKVPLIHTDQSAFLSMALSLGYQVFVHFASEKVVEIKYGVNSTTGRKIRASHNIERLVLAGEFGSLSE